MDLFDPARRDLLKLGTIGAAAAVSALPSFAQSPSAGTAPLFYDVRAHGAIGDGKNVDSVGINKAIEAAAAAGGGTVYIPAGTWTCFSLRLQSNIHLYLAQGATLLAADSPLPGQTTGYRGGTYDAAEPKTAYDAYQDYGHNHWHNSLLWGEGLHDLSITGPGLIHGKGLSNGRGWVKEVVPFKAEQPGVGNKTIALKNCRNVLLRDFSILKGGHFGLLLTGVDNLTIDNLTIDTDRDGMDLDCCKNVRVSNCTVNAPWDDAICPKSSYALGYAKPTENMTITNCLVTGYYVIGSVIDGTFKKFPPELDIPRNGRIKCGTESNGGFRNITISNCVFEGCEGLALESADGALCEDIAITNITMRDAVSAPLFFRLNARMRGPKENTRPGTMQRILVNNVVSYNCDARICSLLSGIPDNAMRDIKLSNLYLHHKGGGKPEWLKAAPPELVAEYPDPGRFGPLPAQGLYLRHIRNLELSHVEVAAAAPDPRTSFYLQNVQRADFLAVTAPAGQPAFTFNQVTDLRIVASRAAPDTTLATADGKTI